MFNDGTAMVFFMLFADMTKGGGSTFGGVLFNFCALAGGGPLLGFIFGMIGSLWLKRIINDDILIINITFVMCYLLFYMAENMTIQVSGILALVTLGLFMSAMGRTNIYSES